MSALVILLLAAAPPSGGADLLLEEERALPPERSADLIATRLVELRALAAREGAAAKAVDRARLAAILDRPEFANARRRSSGALQQLFARLVSWLMKLFETSEAETYANTARFAVLAAALAVVLAAALRLARRRRPRRIAESTPERLELKDPSVHLGLAQAALASDPREAIREGLLGLLSSLERRQLARPDRVKTNRELADELPSRGAPPELHAAVARLVRWYDRTFYSLEPVPPAQARDFLEEVGRLRAHLAEGAR